MIFQFGGQRRAAGRRATADDRTVAAVGVCVRKGLTTTAAAAEAFAGRATAFDVKPSELVHSVQVVPSRHARLLRPISIIAVERNQLYAL